MKTISPGTLNNSLEDEPPVIIDVRLEDDFSNGHLPNSINNCVFEVSFHERLEDTAADPQQAVVVYGANAKSHEARMAAEKLLRKGYTDVAILEGGIKAWEVAGYPTETIAPLPSSPPRPDGQHALDLEECHLKWVGRNLLNQHEGTIDIVSGHLDFDDGELVGGEFQFDLQTIKCVDLDGTPGHDILVRHLLDHDFLDAAEHPACHLLITSAVAVPESSPGTPNLNVTADLTMRGMTERIEFTAMTGLTPDGKAAAQASFSIDRTRWGILYGSARFFHRLAGHLVNDQIEFQARIATE